MKWNDKRDVLMLSTNCSTKFVEVQKRDKVIKKPEIVIQYNRIKGYIDLSDQMSSYSSPLRKTVKWYRKIGIEILLNTSVINSLILFKKVTGRHLQITDYREHLVNWLTNKIEIEKPQRQKHILVQTTSRKRCVRCYSDMSASRGRKYAQSHCKRIKKACKICLKTYCNDCFF